MTRQEKFGRYIRRRRRALKLSAHEFAAKSRLTPATISRLENGRLDPRLSYLIRISQVVGESLPTFLHGANIHHNSRREPCNKK